jgi:6,7-dimethyl-8-ribityllumazine synthase
MRVAIIEARYYDHIADMLLEGAKARLTDRGASFEVVTVPGALEIPGAIARLKGQYDAFVALGCVIRGETIHFELVAGESARAIMDLTVQHQLAIGNAILTTEDEEQALDRADPARRNNAGHAVDAALILAGIGKTS